MVRTDIQDDKSTGEVQEYLKKEGNGDERIAFVSSDKVSSGGRHEKWKEGSSRHCDSIVFLMITAWDTTEKSKMAGVSSSSYREDRGECL